MLSKQFILAGSAIFTVSCQDGSHLTYRVQRVEPKELEAEYCQLDRNDDAALATYEKKVVEKSAFFAQLLTGPNNTKDYTYIGKLDVKKGEVFPTRKSTMKRDSRPIVVLNWALYQIWRQNKNFEHRIRHAGKCSRCNIKLTVPVSIDTGLGPICAQRMGLVE